MYCQVCGNTPAKHVEFYQNIGALVMRFHKKIDANLCKPCINKYFWQMTGTTLILGWWGVISAIVTPIFLINNIVRYLGSLGLASPSASEAHAVAPPVQHVPSVPPPPPVVQRPAQSVPPPAPAAPVPQAPPQQAAPEPELTQQVVDAINPHWEQIVARLNAQEDHGRIATDIAAASGVTPAEATLYIHALLQQSQEQA